MLAGVAGMQIMLSQQSMMWDSPIRSYYGGGGWVKSSMTNKNKKARAASKRARQARKKNR